MKTLFLFQTLVLIFGTQNLFADSHGTHEMEGKSKLSYRGHFQFRTESSQNRRGVQGSRQSEQSVFRLRPYLKFTASEKLEFNLTPQATKGFGADSGGSVTSGGYESTAVNFFEANMNYKFYGPLTLTLGRQALEYGDQMLIGEESWENNGRSFDALKLNWVHAWGWTDFVYSKISDNATTLSSTDDAEMYVLYNSFDINQYLKPLDLYYIHHDDDRTGGTESNTVGFRVLGSHGYFFYRTENDWQSGSNIGDDAHQYNVELGARNDQYSASLEYSLSGKDHMQLYADSHKFLGSADVLGRRNLEQMAINLKGNPVSWFKFKASYHMFTRDEKTHSAYKHDGTTAWGTAGNSDDIGNEFDLCLKFKTSENISLKVGGAWFSPGQYLKDQDATKRDETTNFYYVQLKSSF